MIEPSIVISAYLSQANLVNSYESKRNVFGKSYVYEYNFETSNVFNSFYGNINNCKVKSRSIIL